MTERIFLDTVDPRSFFDSNGNIRPRDDVTPAMEYSTVPVNPASDDHDRRDSVKSLGRAAKLTQHHRRSRRGGRSFPEASDSDLDPYWNGTR